MKMISCLCALLLMKSAIIVYGELNCNGIEYIDEDGDKSAVPVDVCYFDMGQRDRKSVPIPTMYRCDEYGTDIIKYEYESNDYDCSGNFVSGLSIKASTPGNYSIICDRATCPWVLVRTEFWNDNCSRSDLHLISDKFYVLDYCDSGHYYHECVDRVSVVETNDYPQICDSENEPGYTSDNDIVEKDCFFSYGNAVYKHIICGNNSNYSYSPPITTSLTPINVTNNNKISTDLDCNAFIYNDGYGDDVYPTDVCHVELNAYKQTVPTMYQCNDDGNDILRFRYGSTDYDCTGDVVSFESVTYDLSKDEFEIICDQEICPWIIIREYPVDDCSYELNEKLFADELYIAYLAYNDGYSIYDECIDDISVVRKDYFSSGELHKKRTISQDECGKDWAGGDYHIHHIICGEGSSDSVSVSSPTDLPTKPQTVDETIANSPSPTTTNSPTNDYYTSNSSQLNSFFILFGLFIFVQFVF